MGNRASQPEEINVETLKEEIAVDVIVKVSAELNHQLLQHEARLMKHDEQIMELNNQIMEDLRMLKATMLMHTKEIKVLHDTKKNIRVKRSIFWSSSSPSSQKVHPQNKSERLS
jgi:hypothetical protein